MVYLKYAGERNTAEKKRVTRMEKLQKTITELNDKLNELLNCDGVVGILNTIRVED